MQEGAADGQRRSADGEFTDDPRLWVADVRLFFFLLKVIMSSMS